jgi:DNA-binding beta-propeller fold protein YncE
MKSSKLLWLGLVMLVLLLTGCASGPNAPSSTLSTVKLDNSLVSRIAEATQSGTYQTPLDATPDLNGSTIYFTAHGPHGAGVFQVHAAGGAATEVFTGKPFLSPRGIALSSDGQQLYVADPAAGQIFVLSLTGGAPTVLKGSAGTAPQNLSIVQQTLYFTGIDPASKLAAVLKLPITGADAPTVIARGAPLVAPDGVVANRAGTIYVADRSASGNGLGTVFKIVGTAVTPILSQIHLGDPAGIALSPDESLLLISALQASNLHDQVLLLNLTTLQTGSVTKVVGLNVDDAGGLHASPGDSNILAWAGLTGKGTGGVYIVMVSCTSASACEK